MSCRVESFEPREHDDINFLYGSDDNGIPKGWISLTGKYKKEPRQNLNSNQATLVIQTKELHVYSRIEFNILETDGKTIELTIGVDWNNEPIKAVIPLDVKHTIQVLGRWVFVIVGD
jgi:hypothetical protein